MSVGATESRRNLRMGGPWAAPVPSSDSRLRGQTPHPGTTPTSRQPLRRNRARPVNPHKPQRYNGRLNTATVLGEPDLTRTQVEARMDELIAAGQPWLAGGAA